MTTRDPDSSVRPPQQERSKRTLERILRATERLLEKRAYEEISVQAIVRGARTSVGAFYTRFPDKAALLTALYDRYAAGVEEHIEAWRADRPDPDPGLAGAARWVAEYLVDSFRGRRNLLRALALHVRQHPDEVDPDMSAQRLAQHRFLELALLEHRERIRDAQPERAVRTAIFLAACACRERILFHETPHARALEQSDDRLISDLTRMLAGFLLCPEPTS